MPKSAVPVKDIPDPIVTVESAPPPAAVEATFAHLLGTKQRIKVPTGKMLHLYTSVWFTPDPKKVEVDQFIVSQLDAGKMVVSED